MADVRRVYWDTSLFICFLNRYELERRRICEDILRHAQAGAILIHTSVWSIAETVRPKAASLPGAKRLTPREIALIEGMFRWSWIRKIDVDQRVAFKAVELSRDFGGCHRRTRSTPRRPSSGSWTRSSDGTRTSAGLAS